MIRCLSILLFLPLFLFGYDGSSIIYPQRPVCAAQPCDDADNPYGLCMYCYIPGVEGDDLPGGNPILTPQACAQFKADIESYISAFNDAYQHSVATIGGLQSESSEIKSKVVTLRQLNVVDDPVTNSMVSGQLDDIDSLADSVWNYGEALKTDAVNVSNTVARIVRQVRNLDCDNQVCSGSGSNTSCPCVDEIQEIINTLTTTPFTTIDDIYDRQLDMVNILRNIEQSASNCSYVLDFVWSRLQSPDDRMASEIDDILKKYITTNGIYFTNVLTRTWNMSELMYDLKRALSGDGSLDGDKLNLSSEGMIGLYNALGSFMTYAVSANSNIEQINFFSNVYKRVFQYYDLFNKSVFANSDNTLYRAMNNNPVSFFDIATNISYGAAFRYNRLVSASRGLGVTNWFDRIEFYLQSILGWYDDFSPSSEVVENQKELTESSFQHRIHESTNDLTIVSISSASNRISSTWSGFVNVFKTYEEYQLTPPSRLVLSPEFTLGGHDFPGVIVNPSVDWADYIGPIRDCTTVIAYGTIIVALLLLVRYVVIFVSFVVVKVCELFKD